MHKRGDRWDSSGTQLVLSLEEYMARKLSHIMYMSQRKGSQRLIRARHFAADRGRRSNFEFGEDYVVSSTIDHNGGQRIGILILARRCVSRRGDSAFESLGVYYSSLCPFSFIVTLSLASWPVRIESLCHQWATRTTTGSQSGIPSRP